MYELQPFFNMRNMNTNNANTAGGRQLKSELARICLPAPHAHAERNLAWTNSICLLFLIIGWLASVRPRRPCPSPNIWRNPRRSSSLRLHRRRPSPNSSRRIWPQEKSGCRIRAKW
jgi:hypothetical protein